MCFINLKKRKMTFSGARFSLWRANRKGVIEIKGDRKGVGYRRYPLETTYTDIALPFEDSDSFYLTTDGLIDQIGGSRGRSFGKRRFQGLLKKNLGMPMAEQEAPSARPSPPFKVSKSAATTSRCWVSSRTDAVLNAWCEAPGALNPATCSAETSSRVFWPTRSR